MKRKINPFIPCPNLNFGDFILFQEYQKDYNNRTNDYNVTHPILGIYLGYFIADQTLGFYYTKWINSNREEEPLIYQHIEWMDYIDILGHWKQKPNVKEILSSYRKQNIEKTAQSDEIDWDNCCMNIF